MVVEVIQKSTPDTIIVMMPGTHPKTLKYSVVSFEEI